MLLTHLKQNALSGEEAASLDLKPGLFDEYGGPEETERRSLPRGYSHDTGLPAVAYSVSGLVMAKVVFRNLFKISVCIYLLCFLSTQM